LTICETRCLPAAAVARLAAAERGLVAAAPARGKERTRVRAGESRRRGGGGTHFESFLPVHWWGVSLDLIWPLVRMISTISSSLVVSKTVSSSCLLGRARMPCEPWPVWKTSNESTMSTSGIELRTRGGKGQRESVKLTPRGRGNDAEWGDDEEGRRRRTGLRAGEAEGQESQREEEETEQLNADAPPPFHFSAAAGGEWGSASAGVARSGRNRVLTGNVANDEDPLVGGLRVGLVDGLCRARIAR